jgi:hypothetical protein
MSVEVARLTVRDGSELRVGRAIVLSVAWGAGAGIGVALGAVLTALGGAGVPGLSGLQLGTDLVVVPWVVGGLVAAGHLGGTLLLGLIRGRRARQDAAQDDERNERSRDDGVDRKVGSKVPPSQS